MKIRGLSFTGNNIASVMVLPGVVMGRTAPTKRHPNGRTFIVADRDLSRVSFTG